jgi:hypothetical protein
VLVAVGLRTDGDGTGWRVGELAMSDGLGDWVGPGVVSALDGVGSRVGKAPVREAVGVDVDELPSGRGIVADGRPLGTGPSATPPHDVSRAATKTTATAGSRGNRGLASSTALPVTTPGPYTPSRSLIRFADRAASAVETNPTALMSRGPSSLKWRWPVP